METTLTPTVEPELTPAQVQDMNDYLDYLEQQYQLWLAEQDYYSLAE